MMESQFRVAVLVACYNRREKTVAAMQSLIDAKPDNWDLRVYLSDDGSTDGTAEAVCAMPISVKVIQGPGNWYWAHSMYQAEIAIDEKHDAIIWLNDDVLLESDALARFAQWNQSHPSSVLVGQFCDPQTRELTYGGMKRLGRHPLKYKPVLAENEPVIVDTMNGNLVMIPKVVSDAVGTIDGGFAHAYADIDYGLRAKKIDFDVVAIPNFVGTCARNEARPRANKLSARLRDLHNPKSLPPSSQYLFLKRHGGAMWLLYFVMPYVKVIFLGKTRVINR